MKRDVFETLSIHRRNFIKINMLSTVGAMTLPTLLSAGEVLLLKPSSLLKGLKAETEATPLEGAVWYTATETGEGLFYSFPKGSLSNVLYLTSDILVDGNHLAVFLLRFQEGENGPAFGLRYKGLNQAQARIRLPLNAVDQNRWRLEREGAWLKPTCEGDRVDLANVDRMTITILYKSDRPVRWCQTPFALCHEEPPRLQTPILPRGKLVDEMGQSLIHEWPGKTSNPALMSERLKKQFMEADQKKWPESFSRWGGWNEKKFEATGFFRTDYDSRRWWLVDPDGYPFWSAGLDCVTATITCHHEGLESALNWIPGADSEYKDAVNAQYINYLGTNFIRTFGADRWKEDWAKITLSLMREFGFNTVANWSEWQIARQAKFPYVIPLSTRLPSTPKIYRDFPDVYHPNFQIDAQRYGEQLKDVVNDPALIGYFLLNEPTWGFSSESPAAGMLFNTPVCETRKVLAEFLSERYADNDALSKAWKIETTFDQVAKGDWKTRLTEEAKQDLFDFSEIMVERFFRSISEGCKAADPHHLNLGIRYQGIPPQWTIPGMKCFDVFSANCYLDRVPPDVAREIGERLKMPVMIGEFHFGALDVGLPSPGLVHVRTQTDRGRAYRYFVEDAAANPFCVGVHYFTLYDQSAMGRFDGENYNIGFLDICNRPYPELAEAARQTHERMYRVAEGQKKPFADKPDYLPRLF